MTDVDTTATDPTPAGADGEQDREVTPDDMIRRGVGLKLDAIEDGTPAAEAVAAFRDLQERFAAAERAADELKDERNQALKALRDDHNVGFTAIAEIVGATSSLAMYLYERASGKTAKQIREESKRSREAKERFLESDPDRKSARKQSPEEKAFRKQQRDALKAFLEQERARKAAAGEDTSSEDAALAGAQAEQEVDDAED